MSNQLQQTLDFLRGVQSTRKFKVTSVADNILKNALRIAQRAPSTSNLQPYSVIHITDVATKQRLFDAMVTQEFVLSAPEWFMVCADWSRNDILCEVLGVENEVTREAKLTIGMVDASIFAHHFSLALMASGLAVCLIASPYTALLKVADILNMRPENCMPLHLVVTGYSENESQTSRPRYPLEDILHEDLYKSPSRDRVSTYLETANKLTNDNYFKDADVSVSSLHAHYQEKFGRVAALRTWQPMTRDIAKFFIQIDSGK